MDCAWESSPMVNFINWIRNLKSPILLILLIHIGIRAQPLATSFLPAIAVVELHVTDSAGYAKLVGEINQAMKEKYGVPLFLRAYGSSNLTGEIVEAFSLSPSATFENLADNQQRFLSDPKFGSYREELKHMGNHGRKTWLKAVRFDGTNSPGWLLNYLVDTRDEAGLLQRIEQFSALSENQGLEVPLINVFRVIVGESSFTHLVSVNTDSAEKIAKIMDVIAAQSWSFGFTNGVVVKNTGYQELLP